MPLKLSEIKLVYFVVVTLLLVGVVPLVVTGWLLSDRSGRELRAVEGRYQTQLVQDKARQIEMFGQHYGDLVESFVRAFELSDDFAALSSPTTQAKLGRTLKENPNLLALFVKPVNAEPLSVYRAERIGKSELENLSAQVAGKLNDEKLKDKKLVFGKPQNAGAGGEPVLTIAAPVLNGGDRSAIITAVVSLREIAPIMSETPAAADEKGLWRAGLPIVFVVDENGRAVFHPDSTVVTSRKNLGDLKIVDDWRHASRQIQSALVPFAAEYDGEKYEMIGAYSTASFDDEVRFGVIAMQDESTALASVGEMRRQTWLISSLLAVVALVVGFVFAKQLTAPVRRLVQAAEKIAAGNLSTRIESNKIKEFGTLGATFNLMSESLAEHIANLAKAAEENRELFVGTVKALAAAIDGKDRYTRGHSERVSRFSVAMGKRLGMDETEIETLRISALLHDVGKIAIDDAILKKPSALTDAEFEVMKTHPQQGYKIMSQIPAMKDFLPGMYMHHEMVDGAGYPQGLKGDEIPLQAKIISVADTFDAMTTDRPYQKGMNLTDALKRIESFVGTRYDARVVEALIAACEDGQIRAVGAAHPKSASIQFDKNPAVQIPTVQTAENLNSAI